MTARLDTKVYPAVWCLAAVAAQRGLARPRPASGLRKVASAGLAAAGLALGLWAVDTFRRQQTTIDPLDPEKASTLVTGGPFGHTRNPMYVAMGLGLLGHSLWLGRWRTLLPVAGYLAAMTQWQVKPEERAMEQLFGAEYEDYAARVRRWV